MIYKGIGGHWSPHTPHVESLIGKRLQNRGLAGTRATGQAIFGSTDKNQALEYALNESISHLKVVTPQPGSIISWIPGNRDALLCFGSHLSNLHWNNIYHYKGRSFERLVRDIQGDIQVAETYLSLGREKNRIGMMIDSYLDGININEVKIVEGQNLDNILGAHTGEVWINGPCVFEEYDPAIHDTYSDETKRVSP